MKHFPVKAIFSALAAFTIMAGCGKQSGAPHYEFEPVPHPLIVPAGIDSSRNARVAADWISSPTIYVLAILENNEVPGLALLNSEDGGDSLGLLCG